MQLTRPRPAPPPARVAANGSSHAAVRPVRLRARRGAVLAGRGVLWAAIVLLALRGGVATVTELTGPGTPVAPNPTAGDAAFPVDDARALATRFAYDYLSYGPAGTGARDLLAGYGPAQQGELGWDGAGAQTVDTAVAIAVDVESDGRAVVVVAARVDGPRWLHLAVPIALDDGGRLSVAGSPALVAGPPVGAAPPAGEGTVDVALSRELMPVMESFFAAYASGRADDLAYYLPVGRSLRGLDGVVELDALLELRVAEGGPQRDAKAIVRWRDSATGAALTQRYDVQVIDDAGRWYVQGLGAVADPAPPPGADAPRRTDGRGGTR